MKPLKLYNGVSIPNIGFGTWKLLDNVESYRILMKAINCGYRLIDTATHYKNEQLIGKVLKDSEIERTKFFLTSKVWVDSRDYNSVISSFNETLKNLQTDYLDLYLIHWPASKKQYGNYKEINLEVWSALEDLYLSGKVKSIGVSNYNVEYLSDLLKSCRIKPMVNQIEFHPGFLQQETLELCKKYKIQVQAWSPLGHGEILENELLVNLGNKYKKSTAQLILKWIIQKDIIPLPKTCNENHLINNIKLNDFELSDEDILKIDCLEYCGGLALNPDNFN